MAATYSSLVGVAVGGKYEIRRVLGVGGMGVVCEAVHLDLGKRVAVKLIDKTMKESELIVTRFRREARAAGQIKSEHIVDVFDVGADQRIGLYMVMEFLVGEDLQSRLERDKKIDVRTAVMIAHQIARGLAKAHEVGVIHRDLKPANVFLTQRDNGQMLVKLLDFGVSKLLGDDPGSARITGSGAPIGTPLYMSPEQAEGRDSVDGRSDVWSLGAVLYEALAGAPPFADRGSYHGTIVGILTSRPSLLHDAAPWVPPDVAAVVDAMLVHDAEARIPNASVVAQRLLDAFPTVLPDGTGHHTAVIVSQAAAAVDATGDTEVFNSASMSAALVRSKNPVSYPVGPPSQRSFAVGPPSQRFPAPPPQATGPKPPEDSTRTLPDAGPSEALQTGTATPVGPHLRAFEDARASSGGRPDSVDFDRTVKTQNPRSVSSVPVSKQTAPLPPPAGASSSSPTGVALPLTPPAIEPLPSSVRDNASVSLEAARGPRVPKSTAPMPGRADRSRRPRLITFASVLLAVAAVAVGGFLAGRHINPDLDAAAGLFSKPAPTTHAPSASAAPAVTESYSPSSPPAPAPAPTPSASVAVTASPPATAPTGSASAGSISIVAAPVFGPGALQKPVRKTRPRPPASKPSDSAAVEDVPSTME